MLLDALDDIARKLDAALARWTRKKEKP